MRIKHIACMGLAFMASLSVMKAATGVLTTWTFDNLSSGTVNSSPAPSAGIGAAGALGLANSYNNTNSLNNPTIVTAPAGSASGDANAWQISGSGAQPNGGDGWSTNAPIGTQGAQFSSSTYGYYGVTVSFNVYVPSTGEANMQVQYTTEGNAWHPIANITSGGIAVVENNSTSTNTIMGTYLKLSSGWNNNITVSLSGLSGADNNPSFAVRLVNASTGTDDVDTTGAVYNNTSGNWTLDDVVIQGTSIDTIADWTFLLYGTGPYAYTATNVENPLPDLNFAYESVASAACIGFDITNYNFGSGLDYSTNAPDVTTQAGSSTPNNPYCWRVRGQPGNGWTSIAPIGSQGGEFDVSTINYSNIILTFDLYFTSQGEAKMCVLYTTNGWTNSFTANTLAYAANPQYIFTNDQTADPNTVDGTYFYQTAGQNWYNQLAVDFSGLPNVDNNPYFGVRVVNAAMNGDDLNYLAQPYNNSSGNCRFGNVAFGGQYNGLTPPVVSAAIGATVDNPFTNTFVDNPNWRASIAAIYINGAQLTNAYNVSNPGELIFSPSQSQLLQVAGVDSIIIYATNYSTVRITQPLAAGVFQSLTVPVQTLGPSASGGTLEVNPVLVLADQYGNTTTNPYANVSVQAVAGGTTGWILGGATSQQEVDGVITFTNLSATLTSATPVNGAAVTLVVSGYTNSATLGTTTNITLPTFSIGAAPVPFTPGNIAALQIDTLSNNTTFSMIEVKDSVGSQTTPVNIVPVSATGTNSLRESPAGTTGRLALSDDGTLLTFAAFADGSAATPDETLNLNRAAVGMNYTNGISEGATYVSTSLGGSQARAACTLDDINYFADDKGGLYFGNGPIAQANVNAQNNVVVKCFGPQADSVYSGHTAYVETQKAVAGEQIPVVYMIYNNGGWIAEPNNLGNDPNATDFYMVSTNCGATFDVMYTCDQISAKQGIINKYSWAPGIDPGNPNDNYGWASSGSWTNTVGIDGMFVATNGSDAAYIYFTTGAGGTAGNSIYRVADSAGWNQNMNLIATNLIYTTSKTASMKGLVFCPQKTANSYEPMPTPVLTAQNKLGTNAATFSISLSPDDSVWRSSITAITVNGTALPTSAYTTTTAGVVKFTLSQAPILQSPGVKTIVFSSTGYVTNSITQTIVGTASQLVITTQPKAPLADGGQLSKQPIVTVEDSAGDVIFVTTNVTAAATQGTWTLAGSANITNSAGVMTYTNLSAFSGSAVTGATITFNCGTLSATSSAFNIPAPVYSQLKKANVANGGFAFTFTNNTGLVYSVLGTNNIAAPVSTWPVIGTAIENPAGSGIYDFTNTVGTNSQFYYLLRQQP